MKDPTEQSWLSNTLKTATHKTVTSQVLISYDLALLPADLWHCSEKLSNLLSCSPATKKFATTASFRLFRLVACILLHRFRLTVSTTEQLRSTAALLRREVSDVECTVALSHWTEPSSNLFAATCSAAKHVLWLSVLSAGCCVRTDNAVPASCVAEERCTEHRMPLSRMTSNDPTLLCPTPHVPNSKFSNQLET